jgi:energy-coupling factor transport system permease protein
MTATTPPILHADGPATAWRRTDPLTRLTVAVVTMAAALVLGQAACLLALAVAAVLLPAWLAEQLGPTLRTSLLLALPLAASAAIVNLLFSPGTTVEGAALAATVALRVVTMAGAAVLFYGTTTPGELVASLRYHGLPARATFVIHNGVAMLPRLAERAQEVTAAQRARGLDTEGNPLRRARGVIALAVPTVLGAVAEAETRTLALETRGFTRPGRTTVLRVPRDSGLQRLLRWGSVASLGVLVMARLAGVLPC